MNNLDYVRVGWSLSAIATLLHAFGLLRISLLKGADREMADNLISLTHPGYTTLNAMGVVIVLLEAFVCAWIIAAIFVTVYNALQKKA